MAVGCSPGDGARAAILRASAARISIADRFGSPCSSVSFAIFSNSLLLERTAGMVSVCTNSDIQTGSGKESAGSGKRLDDTFR